MKLTPVTRNSHYGFISTHSYFQNEKCYTWYENILSTNELLSEERGFELIKIDALKAGIAVIILNEKNGCRFVGHSFGACGNW